MRVNTKGIGMKSIHSKNHLSQCKTPNRPFERNHLTDCWKNENQQNFCNNMKRLHAFFDYIGMNQLEWPDTISTDVCNCHLKQQF